MAYNVHKPENTPIVYVIWSNGCCCHIGDGKTFLRVSTWIIMTKGLTNDDLRKSGPDDRLAGYTAALLYVDETATRDFTFHVDNKSQHNASGNIERLLQTLHCWQRGQLPEDDAPRGIANDASGNSTGCFVSGWHTVEQACRLYEELGVSPTDKPWPSLCGDPTPPPQNIGERYLTFQVDLDPSGNAIRFKLGYTYYQTHAGVPQYNHSNYLDFMIWERDEVHGNWKGRRVAIGDTISDDERRDILSDLGFDQSSGTA